MQASKVFSSKRWATGDPGRIPWEFFIQRVKHNHTARLAKLGGASARGIAEGCWIELAHFQVCRCGEIDPGHGSQSSSPEDGIEFVRTTSPPSRELGGKEELCADLCKNSECRLGLN